MTEKQDRFSHAMEQCRQAYRDIPTPPELEGAVEDAIQAGGRPRLPRRGLKRAAAAAAGLCACFVVLTSPAVAAAVDDVPVLGQLCRILTGQAYESREETSYVQVQLPQIENTGDSSLEQRVNLEISAVLSREVDESKERARQYFYNLDLETGQSLTLRDVLGPNWAAQGAAAVEEQLSQWDQEQKALLFDDVDLEALLEEKEDFYLQEDGTVVVVFDKYEIAAGAAGVLEFPIGKLPQA